jgi:hypothetical protein
MLCAPALYGKGAALIQVLPFPHPPIALDPEAVKSVSLAFDQAWEEIRTSGSGFARPAYRGAMREEIARHVIDMVGRGETDQTKLTEGAIVFLGENYRY